MTAKVRITVCSDPLYIVSNYVKWATTSWTYNTVHANIWQPSLEASLPFPGLRGLVLADLPRLLLLRQVEVNR